MLLDSKARKILSLVAYGVFIFLIQEIFFRSLFPLPEIQNFDRALYSKDLQVGQKQSNVGRIHLRVGSSADGAVFLHKLNGYGFRDREWKIDKMGRQRVLFIGDSFVEGEMAPQNQVITEGFKSKMREQRASLDVMNMGMMGTGLTNYLRLIRDAVPIFKPEEVFLFIYANDFPRIPEVSFENPIQPMLYSPFEPRLLSLARRLKTGARLPFRWAWKTHKLFHPVPHPDNPWSKNEMELSIHVKPEFKKSMKEGDFNPFVVNLLLHYERNLPVSINANPMINAIKEYLGQHDAELRVVYIPTRSQVTTHYLPFDKSYCLSCPDSLDLTALRYQIQRQQLGYICKALAIPFLDLTDWVLSQEEQGNHLYWNYDDHMLGSTYFEIGERIFHWNSKLRN